MLVDQQGNWEECEAGSNCWQPCPWAYELLSPNSLTEDRISVAIGRAGE